MADDSEEIDLEQIVWDPRYRRRVIEQLNRHVRNPDPLPAETPQSEPERAPQR